MAKKRKNSKLVSIIIVVALAIISVFVTENFVGDSFILDGTNVTDGKMLVEFIDVGQGDCTLITAKDTVILVDGGESGQSQKVINYLKNKNIKKIDCCIATHPHTDHIGSLAKVFDEFEISDVIMPEIPEDIIPTTKTYERFLQSVADNAESVIAAKCGDTYSYGDVKIEIFGPVTDYDDLNNMSVVSRISFGNTAVMLTGDAETPSESDIMAFDTDLSSDLLKVGHHGSRTSTGKEWLYAVNPDFAVISCGLNNDYGHPHKQLTKRLDDAEVEYYRTDLMGDIVFESDGRNFVLLDEAE